MIAKRIRERVPPLTHKRRLHQLAQRPFQEISFRPLIPAAGRD